MASGGSGEQRGGGDGRDGGEGAAPLRRPPMRGRDWLVLGALVLAVTTASQLWQDHLAGQDGPALAAAAGPGDIHMISSVTCIFCQRAREWMQRWGVSHTECFIERDTECLNQYRALQAPGTPVLLVRGQVQLGFNAEQVLRRLAPDEPR